ncbi:MAG TPA: triose-phosphate isomerase family protein [Candidatus Babeliales bacterium]|nr:triose-phosphate isomerase family protein [Candidatus Babeliales bacterium]
MKYLYVANWKMNLSFNQSIQFCNNNIHSLQQLTKNADIVICPSFDALAPLADIVKNSSLALGAQNCSEHARGAYTGEISALSLAEIGAHYCIVGHSERRLYYHETTQNIIQKIYLLYAANILPIICIGENHQDFLNKQTLPVLKEQLEPILSAIAQQEHHTPHLIIAYEPIWSIGTGVTPEQEQLNIVFTSISEIVQQTLPQYRVQLLYGGSVNHRSIITLKKVSLINGFLIGSASTHFEQFKNIIDQ